MGNQHDAVPFNNENGEVFHTIMKGTPSNKIYFTDKKKTQYS